MKNLNVKFRPRYDFSHKGRLYLSGRYYNITVDTAVRFLKDKKGYIRIIEKNGNILTKYYTCEIDKINALNKEIVRQKPVR